MTIYKTFIENVEDEIEIEVEFDYQPYEAPTHTYAGCCESVDICEVRLADTNIEICLLPEVEDSIVEEILEYRKEANDYAEYGYLLED